MGLPTFIGSLLLDQHVMTGQRFDGNKVITQRQAASLHDIKGFLALATDCSFHLPTPGNRGSDAQPR